MATSALWRFTPRRAISLALSLAAAACGESEPEPAPWFPADYRASYVEVRDCRLSSEHELSPVRVLADPEAAGPYATRAQDFQEGAIVLKEEYDFADRSCSGEVVRYTVMQREAAGTAPERLDWRWQKVDADRRVLPDETTRCAGCHQTCGEAPLGYQGTCTVETQ